MGSCKKKNLTRLQACVYGHIIYHYLEFSSTLERRSKIHDRLTPTGCNHQLLLFRYITRLEFISRVGFNPPFARRLQYTIKTNLANTRKYYYLLYIGRAFWAENWFVKKKKKNCRRDSNQTRPPGTRTVVVVVETDSDITRVTRRSRCRGWNLMSPTFPLLYGYLCMRGRRGSVVHNMPTGGCVVVPFDTSRNDELFLYYYLSMPGVYRQNML